eukprot:CAMPEP_0196664060 /NCGR_PEP_ID=MMETSP1086-20130531/55459_1 /TAXON_ID=77921 /ORGANISM="Cyanoptyche  gloeocystis , Strain SAG4.97" /LENGTH=132 /DNA_ID=CAMNT_0042000175 /DNA_START=70 /DNA_END=468 /DNA_ORIENTATION=-
MALDKAWGSQEHGASKKLQVMVQVNTSGEASKSGVLPSEAPDVVAHVIGTCPHLKFAGLMTIGKPDSSVRPECFQILLDCREAVANRLGLSVQQMDLSMGMSSDWQQAISMGTTSIRIGSAIFGQRAAKVTP